MIVGEMTVDKMTVKQIIEGEMTMDKMTRPNDCR